MSFCLILLCVLFIPTSTVASSVTGGATAGGETSGVINSAAEYQIKAAYLYHFVYLASWPTTAFDSPNAIFQFCVIGENPFGSLLSTMAKKKKYNGLPIEIKFPQFDNAILGCHLLYIALSDSNRERKIVDKFKNTPLLIISSKSGFASRGGIIEFATVNTRVRIKINRDAARRANIKLSAKLLEVAISVIDEADSR